MLVIAASLPIMTFSEPNTLADTGGGSENDGYLDFDYFIDTVTYLSNIIHNSSVYGLGEIKKGRYFGSDGDKAAADFIFHNFTDTCGFDPNDVRKVQLTPLPETGNKYREFVEVTSYELTINNPFFTLAETLPQNDCYPIVATRPAPGNEDCTVNTNFDHVRVYEERDFIKRFPKWQTGEQPYNLSFNALNDWDIILGEVVFVPSNETVPPHDCETVFLFDEEEGVEDKINNATNAAAIILLQDAPVFSFQNAENYTVPIARVDTENESNDQNLTLIKQLLEEENIIIANNLVYDNKITFVHNMSSSECGPDFNFVILFRATGVNHFGITDIMLSCCYRYWFFNKIRPFRECQGILIYDDRTADCHYMYNQFIDTPRFRARLLPMFALPGFSVNQTVGEFLKKHSGGLFNTISGHVNQIHHKEDDEPGVVAHNVEAYLNITQSPEDRVVVLSSRYDSMWGECAGDSAAGNGIIMGIAKYMQELNQSGIKPKYDVTFLLTTNEENGYTGAEFFSDSHNDNIYMWIGTDQLGFNHGELHNVYKNETHRVVVSAIVESLDYSSLGYGVNHQNTSDIKYYNVTNPPYGQSGVGAEDVVFYSRGNCDTILIHKGDAEGDPWQFHHGRGLNLADGDVIDESRFDWADAKMFYNITWETVKYFLYDPDCWFDGSISYSGVDSPDDPDPKTDSISATFTVKSVLPHDKVRVKAKLIQESTGINILRKNFDFIANSSGVEKTITVTLPPNEYPMEGYYHLVLELHNSTGRIMDIAYPDSGLYNDIDTQNGHEYLYPRGNTNPNKPNDIQGNQTLQIFQEGTFNSSTTDSNNDKLEYLWHWEPGDEEKIGSYESGDLCSMTHRYHSIGWKTIQVKAREDYLGQLFDWYYPGIINRYGSWSEWSEPFDVRVRFFLDFSVSCSSAASSQSAMLSTTLPSVVDIDAIYTATAVGGTEPLSYDWNFGGRYACQDQRVNYSFDETGAQTVTLNVSDYNGFWKKISANISIVNLSASYNLSLPSLFANPDEIIVFNDTSAISSDRHITNWTWDFGDGTFSYQRNATHAYDYDDVYNVTLTITDNKTGIDMYSMLLIVGYDEIPPEITSVDSSPGMLGINISIAAIVTDDISGVKSVIASVTNPDNTTTNCSMTHVVDDIYHCIFPDTWQIGVYNYSIRSVDHANNTNYVEGFNFTVSAEANITVCTTKDTYTSSEYINLTDPPGTPAPSLGYELLDDGAVLHLWNQFDNYYFNTSSGIQLTNHKNQYWSHNVLMLGYYNIDQWNLMYRTDELTGFNRDIEIDENSYVNVTLWKDLSYAGYSFRLAIRYHLGINDCDLTVIPYIKNIGTTSIPYVLGFGWELKDIQINMTTQGDYILVDQDKYLLNQTLDNSYTSLNDTVFYLKEDVTGSQTQSLYLRWNPDLTYKLQVKSRSGQQNAPVTLFIRVGTLAAGQQKSTSLQWYDASQETYYFDAFDANEAWEYDPELMTDETEETFASTRTDTTVELCNGNTCEGDDLGTIQKVELRVNGYYEGKNGGNITLRPIFEETDGENYTFVAPERPEWSQWFDITNDGGRGGGGLLQWSWSEVNKLDCDVEASVGAETTLFCAMVQLRVTYNTAPSVSNPYPPHGTNGISLQPQLNIMVSDPNSDTMNVTWYTNSTSSLLSLRPNANGSITELQRYPTSENANYKCVDETIVNDNDYVYWSGTSWKKDTYNLANRGAVSGVIHSVTVYARCNRAGFGMDPSVPNQGKIVIRSSGSYYYGTEFAPTSTFTYYSHTWSVNPATGAAWSWSAIDALEAGISFIGNEGGSSKCSQVYVVVNYTNPNTWYQFGQNSSVSNGVYRQRFLNASVNGQWWYWKVKADDGTASTWSSVYKFYTGYQSKIENTGETDISGYLLMQVQYYNETTENWFVDNDTVNETTPRIINSSNQLGLDTIFNGQVRASDLTHGTGTYRVYAAFRDPEGNILRTNDDADLEAWWQFSKT